MGLPDSMTFQHRPNGFLPPEEAAAMLDRGGLVLDVRNPDEWAAGHCEASRLMPMDQVPARLDELPRDRPILVVCAAGVRSRHVAAFLRAQGFDAHNLGTWQHNPRFQD
jgi:rhodanese-related sulfurtransferase